MSLLSKRTRSPPPERHTNCIVMLASLLFSKSLSLSGKPQRGWSHSGQGHKAVARWVAGRPPESTSNRGQARCLEGTQGRLLQEVWVTEERRRRPRAWQRHMGRQRQAARGSWLRGAVQWGWSPTIGGRAETRPVRQVGCERAAPPHAWVVRPPAQGHRTPALGPALRPLVQEARSFRCFLNVLKVSP